MRRPDWLDELQSLDAEHPQVDDLEAAALALLRSPNVGRPDWVTRQYDHLVGAGTVLGPGEGDAGVVRLPGSRRGVAVSTDGNGRWCELDPREGARRVVAEAHRNVACTGARPVATTNCLNFGNPERPEIMWQFAEAVAGIGEATEALSIPVTGGNVSLYNETRATPQDDPVAILPTPVLGVLGLLEDAGAAVGSRFRDDGDVVVALGAPTVEGLAGSEFQRVHDDALGGVLAAVDLDLEVRLAATLADLAGASLLRSAHDVSTGGLLGCLADQVAPGLGVTLDAPLGDVDDVQRLFSESPGRVLVTCAAADVDDVVAAAAERDVPAAPVGRVGGDRVAVHGVVDLALAEVLDAVHGAVPRVLGEA